VIGIDVADRMIERARLRAQERAAVNARFQCADFLSYQPEAPFDAVLCAFALFFFADIPAALAKIAAVTHRPGRWAFSFWGDQWLRGPAATLKRDLEARQPGVMSMPPPWSRLSSESKIQTLFQQCGYTPRVVRENADYFVTGVKEWWDVVMNTGCRRYVEALGVSEREDFKREHLANVAKELGEEGLRLYLPVYYVIVDLA
jgi:trans-aconitate methyltransferase